MPAEPPEPVSIIDRLKELNKKQEETKKFIQEQLRVSDSRFYDMAGRTLRMAHSELETAWEMLEHSVINLESGEREMSVLNQDQSFVDNLQVEIANLAEAVRKLLDLIHADYNENQPN